MKIEIHNEKLESRLLKQLEKTGSTTPEELLLRLLETQEEQDRWLADNKQWVNAKVRRGIDQLDQGQGIPEHELDAYLSKLKSMPE
jgi:hypothetical protein